MTRPNILILPYMPTLSHTSRPLEIAKLLRADGCNVLFAGFNTNKSKFSFIEKEGFKCLALFEPDPDTLFTNIRNGKMKFVSALTLDQIVKADINLFKKVAPDLILSDGRFSAMISTQIADIPHVAVVNASSTEYRSIPYIPFFEKIFPLWMREHKNFRQFCDKMNLKIEMAVFDNAMNHFKRLSKKYNLKLPVTATNCLAGKDLTLLADIPEYFPVKNQPDNYHYIGPITWKRSVNTPKPRWWPLPETDKPKIYLTMGTTGENNLFSLIYNYLKKSDFITIITTGSQNDQFKTIPGRIYVEDYIDGEAVLKKSDLVICHGGNGTIYQAIGKVTPIIGIPTIPDQDFNMRRVEALGVGIRIPIKTILKKPDILMDKIQTILTNKDYFKKNLYKLQTSLKKYTGADIAADLIQSYLS
ncbi:glycosyltransferase [Desulfobacter postgatei]|uniref:Glycosyl transferase, UDP-glucuronosyltransferase n=1 Tax=Desulfobacter postgatei 2ac9 TaxID=879212 RepID=I5B2U3_9BACT|nr:glycosyltransferase [Desulfobacter postgatei]EIM63806.1 glycosyl transferase, UDP-glucuronosyltransferase [Desulfobacter postgatei 2ac9]